MMQSLREYQVTNMVAILDLHKRKLAMRVIDRLGDKYERLTVLERFPSKGRDTNAKWLCRCDCGNPVVAYGQDLSRGKVKSCGCLNAERIRQHGWSHSPEYAVWQAMLQRCENPKAQSYSNYGGRGILVCAEWHKFQAFIDDMGSRPKGWSLERIDNDGSYCKANCQWALAKQQNNNTRRNRVVEFNGVTMTLAQWADHLGIGWYCLRQRLDVLRWPLEKALTSQSFARPAAKYSFGGRVKTLREWSAETGINFETLNKRVGQLKWTIERALTEPVHSKGLN